MQGETSSNLPKFLTILNLQILRQHLEKVYFYCINLTFELILNKMSTVFILQKGLGNQLLAADSIKFALPVFLLFQ